ncbi:MAG: hypothetical protein Q9187_004265 [Circinaria calcarea]
MASVEYDFVIVGGGTARLVIAARLSEDPHTQVLVLEAGEDRMTDPRVTTPAFWPTLVGTDADWNFRTVEQTGLAGRSLMFPQGRLLGGSSAINGHAFVATSKVNVDAWAGLGNPGWDWFTMKRYFKKSYTLAKPSEAAVKHLRINYIDENVIGTEGPIQASFPENLDSI